MMVRMLIFVCRQEGWRLEHQDPRDPSSEIIIKGIVFNEMKGVFVCSQENNTSIAFSYLNVTINCAY